jgi:hypothetical protein
MTGQSILDRMEILNQELQLQAGESDVARGLVALNMAQDFFEAAAAKRPNIYGSGSGSITQTANTETSTYPANLLRLDSLWYLDTTVTPNRPAWKLRPRKESGGHLPSSSWVRSLVSNATTGKPYAYWTNGTLIYWDPLPDTTNTVRYYGLVGAADITASGTFTYPDVVSLLLATFAVTILRVGLGDEVADLNALAESTFGDTLDALANFNRDGAVPLTYEYNHQ